MIREKTRKRGILFPVCSVGPIFIGRKKRGQDNFLYAEGIDIIGHLCYY